VFQHALSYSHKLKNIRDLSDGLGNPSFRGIGKEGMLLWTDRRVRRVSPFWRVLRHGWDDAGAFGDTDKGNRRGYSMWRASLHRRLHARDRNGFPQGQRIGWPSIARRVKMVPVST
jgi:hypothetical protein